MTYSYLLLVVMVVASLLLSVVSGYETYLGLLNFMPEGFIGAVFGLIFTLAVQAILFAISWRIAQHVLDPWKQQMPSFAVWIVCAFFSGYFSYFGFFQATGGRDENIRVNAVTVEQGDILQSIENDINTDLVTAHTEALLETPFYEAWKESLRDLIRTADQVRPEIQRAAGISEAQFLAERSELEQTLDRHQRDRAQAEADVRLAGQRQAELQTEVENLTGQIAGLMSEIDDSKAKIAGLESQLEVEGRTGEGPRYREIVINLGTAEAALAQAETRMQELQVRLEVRAREKAIIDLETEQNIEQNRLNQVLADIDAVNEKISVLGEKIEEARVAANINFGEQGPAFNQRIARLQSRDYAAYSELVDGCETIKRQLTDAGLGNQVSEIQCTVFDISGVIVDLRTKTENLANFDDTCVKAAARVVRAEQSSPQLDGIIAQLQNDCVTFAPSADLQEQLGRTLTALAKGRGDQASAFDRASIALLSDRQSNAVISAVFAIIVDLLVLLCALVGRNVGQPEQVRAIDRIIAHLVMLEDNESGFERRLVLPEDRNERALIEPVLNQLLREELAQRAETPEGAPQVLLLRKGSLKRLKAIRTDVLRGAASEAAEQPFLPQPRSLADRRRH